MRSGFARGVRMLALVSLPITAAMAAVGPEALMLVYGDDYSGTEPVLRLMMVVFPVMPLLNVSYALLIGIGKLRALILGDAAAAVVNVALALVSSLRTTPRAPRSPTAAPSSSRPSRRSCTPVV